MFFDEVFSFGDIAETAIGGRGNFIFGAKIFHEAFGAFKARGGSGRTKHTNAGLVQLISQPFNQRRFGADNNQIDFIVACKFHQCMNIIDRNIGTFGHSSNTGITGRAKKRFALP